MGKTTIEEPLFQKKRKFEIPSGFNLNKQFSNSKDDDDYFLIGPSDGKFNNSIAYRNKMKRNTRSVSPPVRKKEISDQKLSRPSIQACKQPQKFSSLLKSRRDEAIQTDSPHKALEAEIRRIRAEIDNRKRILREREEIKGNTKHVKVESELNQQSNTNYSNPVEINYSTNTISTPVAPRQHKSNKSPLQKYSQDQKTEVLKVIQHNFEKKRLSEYQSAYKPPQTNYKLDPIKSIRPSSCKLDKFQYRAIPYDTEYRHEYKPFKYVSIDQLKSTDITKEKNVNIIPLKRPVSAYGIREIKNNDRNINNNRVRALTPPSQLYNKKTSHKNNYISEYNAKYRNYSNVLSISQNQSKLTDKKFQYDWYQEILKLREKADEYRKRDRESHFSREHLAQLDSNSVGYWDPSSTESYAENIEKYKEVLQMPRAGKPSTDLVLDPYNEPPVSQRMKAMFDSQNIAKIMDQDDCSDTDIDQDPEYNCKQSFTCPHSEYTSNIKHIGDTYAGMLPNTKQRFQSDASHYKTDNDLHEITNLEDNNRINNPHIEEWENYPNNHRIRNQNQWDQNSYKKNQRSLDETESITSCSSLSEKSMELSSRLAYETLERAQKQHERVLREKQQYDESKYASNAYSDYKSIQ